MRGRGTFRSPGDTLLAPVAPVEHNGHLIPPDGNHSYYTPSRETTAQNITLFQRLQGINIPWAPGGQCDRIHRNQGL